MAKKKHKEDAEHKHEEHEYHESPQPVEHHEDVKVESDYDKHAKFSKFKQGMK